MAIERASHVQTFLLISFFLTMDVLELTRKLALELKLPEDSSPIQIIKKGLRKLGVQQGDLTPDSAEAVNFVDWQGQIQRGDHLIAREADGVIEHHGIFLGRLDAVTKWQIFGAKTKRVPGSGFAHCFTLLVEKPIARRPLQLG